MVESAEERGDWTSFPTDICLDSGVRSLHGARPQAGCGLGEMLGVEMFRMLLTQMSITLRLPSQGVGGTVQW